MLGYSNWETYVQDRFGAKITRLDQTERQPVVSSLQAVGMSSRAIAPVVGVSDRQVRRDMSRWTFVPPDNTIVGVDAKRYRIKITQTTEPFRISDDEAVRRHIHEIRHAGNQLARLDHYEDIARAADYLIGLCEARQARDLTPEMFNEP